jgi:type IV secretory pathway TraG/TraD family ATPase VirD4
MSLPSLRKDETGAVIDSGDMLIFIAGNSPIYGKQILYFNDKIFSARAKVETPSKSDKSQDISTNKLESMSLDDTIIRNSLKEDGESGQYHQQKRGLSR